MTEHYDIISECHSLGPLLLLYTSRHKGLCFQRFVSLVNEVILAAECILRGTYHFVEVYNVFYGLGIEASG